LFRALPARFRRIGAAEALLQRGRTTNELAQYRYDAVLHFDVPPPPRGGRWIDWETASCTPAQLRDRLHSGSPATLALRGVANARLTRDLALQGLLEDPKGPANARDLRAAISDVGDPAAVDPEDLWRMAEQAGCCVSITWCGHEQQGRYDAVFERREGDAFAGPSATSASAAAAEGSPSRRTDQREWKRLANEPLASVTRRRLAARLQRRLRRRLPEYMRPAAIVLLESLPRTRRGKLDRRALPKPLGARPEWSGGYVAPRDEEEALVAGVWERILGVSPIGAQDDFFDLGGHSMLAVRMVAAIERRSGRRLPLAALFQRATVEHLASLLREPEACPPESSLVPLQREGSGAPLFAVHPAGGTVFCYQLLSQHLGQDRPFYGLQAVGVDGARPPHENVQEMVSHYLAAIRTVQPHGPYLLGGWSLGGNIAFELARQLAGQGERIRLLALIDCGAMPPEREPSEDDFLPIIMGLFPGDDDVTLEQLRQMTPQQHLKYFQQRALQAGVALPELDEDAANRIFDVFKANLKAMWEYRPRPFPGRITLFASRRQPEAVDIARDPSLGWDAWATGGVEIHRVPGRHLDIIKEPNVRILADRLRRCIAEAESQGLPAR
jgi:thioesterase domain-containing protein